MRAEQRKKQESVALVKNGLIVKGRFGMSQSPMLKIEQNPAVQYVNDLAKCDFVKKRWLKLQKEIPAAAKRVAFAAGVTRQSAKYLTHSTIRRLRRGTSREDIRDRLRQRSKHLLTNQISRRTRVLSELKEVYNAGREDPGSRIS